MDDSAKREYIKALIEHLESQKTYNLLFVTFGIGLIALTLNKTLSTSDPLTLSKEQTILLGLSLFFISSSAVFYMIWHILLHLLRIKAVDLYVTLDIDEARRLHYPGNEFFKRWGWISRLGLTTLTLGLTGYVILIYTKIWGANMNLELASFEKYLTAYGSLLVSGAALIVAILSIYFSIKSWRQANRPLVTVRTTSFDSGGNVGTALSLLVENTGNRPAKNIKLSVNSKELESNIVAKPEDSLRQQVEKCFSNRGMIPVLANGKSVSNSFGWLSEDSQATWKVQAIFNVEVSYEDLDGRRFKHKVPLLIADDAGFAGGFWEDPHKKS
ncbi:MAG: hypothetical protein M3367_09620 [Acidobacteriota bacterium]|nr:hypothetical protein [Acidobacteriota bacterium]